jgi:hypothetical protein
MAGFGIPNNAPPTPNSGFNPTNMFRGFNMGNGIRSQFLGWLSYEFRYTDVFSFLVRASTVITTFDWNASDKELRAKYKEMNENMASAWGAVFGRGLGSAVAIGIGSPTALMLPKIGSGALARQVMKEASIEAKEELLDEVVDALRETKNNAGSMLALEGFIRYRAFLKSDKVPEALLASLYGQQTASFIKRGWGEENGETFVISQKIDEKIDGIKNSIVQEFVREAVEGFGDAFIDTGFVIAQGFDDALRQYQLGQRRTTEPEVIEIYPNAENPDEVHVIEGDTLEQVEETAQEVLNNHRVMQNRDVGQIIGSSAESYASMPMLRKLEITFKSIPRPPYMYPNGDRAKMTYISIPNVKRGLTYEKIRRTFGNGQVAYTAGDRWANLKFRGSNRKLQLEVADQQVSGVDALLKQWADLSELPHAESATVSQILDPNANNRKPPVAMYAVKAKLIKSNVNLNGRVTGTPEFFIFDLWQEDEPFNFREQFTWNN